MDVSFFSQDIEFDIQNKFNYTDWIDKVVRAEKTFFDEICFVFCSDGYLLDMNKQFLKHDYYTDVIAFNNNTEGYCGGDIFISVDRVEENAKLYQVDFYHELRRVMIHGILHLIGYDDHTDEQRKKMSHIENKYLEYFIN